MYLYYVLEHVCHPELELIPYGGGKERIKDPSCFQAIHKTTGVIQSMFISMIYLIAYDYNPWKLPIILLVPWAWSDKSMSITSASNDSFSTFFVILFIYFWIKGKEYKGTLFYALALSIKMNTLLYLPGFLLTSVFAYGVIKTLFLSFIVISI